MTDVDDIVNRYLDAILKMIDVDDSVNRYLDLSWDLTVLLAKKALCYTIYCFL